MQEELMRINGKVLHVVYHNEDNFYTVLRFQINDETEKKITVTGTIPNIEKDVLYDLLGRYIEHPRYGMQFVVESYQKTMPESEEGIIRYLSGPLFPGIGKKTAKMIVELLGVDCLKQIREDASILKTIPGLSLEKIEIIDKGVHEEEDGLEELLRFLNVHGIGIRNLIRLNRTYGKEAMQKLKENPYRVIEECDGFGFITADKIAMQLGFSEDDERRLYAYLVSLAMEMCMASGDTYVSYDDLKDNFHKKTSGVECDYEALLQQAIMKRSLVQEDHRIYPISQYESETFTAAFLQQFPFESLDHVDMALMHSYLEDMSESFHIVYDDIQRKTIDQFFDEDFLIVTGGPGTGKTTIIRAMVTLFQLLYPARTIVCAAPTGRAAKRLAELTGSDASTVHSLLQWDLESNTFGKNEEDPLEADLLIVDEFSMVDNWLFYNLLKASSKIKKICIVGDEDQLPSVGPGNVLRDLMTCNLFPVVRLEHIYRQRGDSDVIQLAHDIKVNDVDLQKYQNDVVFLPCEAAQVRSSIIQVVENALEKGYEIDDIQVVSPMYSGNAGIDLLNNALQDAFNPPEMYKKEIKVGYITFREGDKILQLKNQPDDDVFNGDIGILEEIIDAKDSENHKTTIVVDFQGIYVEYTQDTWNHITLAYCISVHKSQGSEYPIVIMPFTRQHTIMLQKKLIYTAVTRARRALVLLGDQQAFENGLLQSERHIRNTTLVERLGKAEIYPF